MAAAALIILLAASLWLIAVGLFMACRPKIMLDFLSLTASSYRVNLPSKDFECYAEWRLLSAPGHQNFLSYLRLAAGF